jgi:hypothetical protein
MVATNDGGIAQFNLRIGRGRGTPLPAIGDEAWLLNRRRTVVLRVGEHVAKLTLSRSRGAQPPVPLEALAQTVAGRLAARLPVVDG